MSFSSDFSLQIVNPVIFANTCACLFSLSVFATILTSDISLLSLIINIRTYKNITPDITNNVYIDETALVIGMGSTVMDGAVINTGVMLGAGSLVSPNKELESGYLWMGTPAKKIRLLTKKEKSYLRYSAEHYMKMKDRYLNAQS